MEYTHIHTLPWAKWKQSNKNKVQYIDLVNKGNQKLYLPVKNKSNQSTNQKTKLKQGAKREKGHESKINEYVERNGKKVRKKSIDMQSYIEV